MPKNVRQYKSEFSLIVISLILASSTNLVRKVENFFLQISDELHNDSLHYR